MVLILASGGHEPSSLFKDNESFGRSVVKNLSQVVSGQLTSPSRKNPFLLKRIRILGSLRPVVPQLEGPTRIRHLVRLLAHWDRILKAMKALKGFEDYPDPEQQRKIERLISFVDGAIESDEDAPRHPLWDSLSNFAPWNIKAMASLSDDLSLALICDGFERIRQALGTPSRWDSATKEIAIAAEFARAGLQVSFVQESGRKRTHDLTVNREGNPTYVEVSTIKESRISQRMLDEAHPDKWDMPEFEGLHVEIEVHKFISTSHREEMRREIAALANEVRGDGVERAFTVPDALEVKMRRLDGDFGGHTLSIGSPDYDRDEIGRVRYRIEDKVEQLPKDGPGLLVIFDSELMTRDFEAPDYSWVVEGVEEAVFEYADLAGLLLVIDMGGAPKAPGFSMSKDHWCAWRLHGPSILVQDRIFIRNRYSPHVLDQRILMALGWPSNGKEEA